MSTEHQQYSPENQEDVIRQYAADHNMEIVHVYADHGRSGLNIAGRSGFNQLMADVENKQVNFTSLLVYDVKRENFAMASGEMTQAEFTDFLISSLRQLEAHSKAGSVHFICMDWRHLKELLAAGEQVYDSLLNVCVWVKNNGGMGSFYRSQHELVFVFRKGKTPHQNNIQLGKYGRNRTNVWEYPGVNTFSKQGKEGDLLALHPTVKPMTLVSDALLDCSAPKDLVLDTFLGSGTTLLSAEQTGRACFGVELNPKYVDVAIRRWQNQTKLQAMHADAAKSFDNIAKERES